MPRIAHSPFRLCLLAFLCVSTFLALTFSAMVFAAEPAPRAAAKPEVATGKSSDAKPADALKAMESAPAAAQTTAAPSAAAAPPAAPQSAAGMSAASGSMPPPVAAPVPAAMASNAVRVAVEVEGTDTLGARLSFQLKETFNSTSLFSLTDAETPKILILLTTESEFASRPAVGSAYCAVWVFYQGANTFPLYLARETGTFSAEGVSDLTLKLAERTRGIAAKYAYLLNK